MSSYGQVTHLINLYRFYSLSVTITLNPENQSRSELVVDLDSAGEARQFYINGSSNEQHDIIIMQGAFYAHLLFVYETLIPPIYYCIEESFKGFEGFFISGSRSQTFHNKSYQTNIHSVINHFTHSQSNYFSGRQATGGYSVIF